MNLYNITQEYLNLANQLIESGGELTPDIEQALIINESNLKEKAINYAHVIRSIDNDINIIDNEMMRLKALKEARIKAQEKLESNIQAAMELYGINKIESTLINLYFRKSESVEVDNMAQLDKKFIVEKLTLSPDKKAIKEAVKSGEEVKGARLITNNNLQIK